MKSLIHFLQLTAFPFNHLIISKSRKEAGVLVMVIIWYRHCVTDLLLEVAVSV